MTLIRRINIGPTARSEACSIQEHGRATRGGRGQAHALHSRSTPTTYHIGQSPRPYPQTGGILVHAPVLQTG